MVFGVRKFLAKDSSAQGTVEYLALLGGVIIVLFLVVAYFTGLFNPSSVSLEQNRSLWNGLDLGLSDAGADTNGNTFFVITNNTDEEITLLGYKVGNTTKDFDSSGTLPLIEPGERKAVFITKQDACPSGICSVNDLSFMYRSEAGLDKVSPANDLLIEQQNIISRANFSGSALVCVKNEDIGICGGGEPSATVVDSNWATDWSVFDANMRATYNLPAVASSVVDTNWATGWAVFDANMRSYYYTKLQIDSNFESYVRIVDFNSLLVPQSCPTGQALKSLGTSFTCIAVGASGGDTNWATDWIAFDANMRSYYPLKSDVNNWIVQLDRDSNWQTSWAIFDSNMRSTYNLPAVGGVDTNTVTAGFTDSSGKWLVDLNTSQNVRVDKNVYVANRLMVSSRSVTNVPYYNVDVEGTDANGGINSDIGLNLNPVATPARVTASLVLDSGVDMNIGKYSYYVSCYTAIGETDVALGFPEITTDATHRTVNLGLPICDDYRVIGRKIYRTLVNGSYFSAYLLATVSNNTDTNYLDTKNDSNLNLTSVGYFRNNTTTRYITVGGGFFNDYRFEFNCSWY